MEHWEDLDLCWELEPAGARVDCEDLVRASPFVVAFLHRPVGLKVSSVQPDFLADVVTGRCDAGLVGVVLVALGGLRCQRFQLGENALEPVGYLVGLIELSSLCV